MTRALMVMGAAVLAGTALFGQQRPAAASLDKARLEAAINKEVIDGDLEAAIAMYQELTRSADRAVAAQSYLRLGQGYRRLGDPQAKPTLQRALEFKDQPQVVAKARAALGLRAQAGSGPTAPSMRRVWAGNGASRHGSVSPDGRLVAFVDPDTGDLAVRDLEAGTSRRLTQNENESWDQFVESKTFSPDGGQIAYVWNVKGERYQVSIVGVGGAGAAGPRTILDRSDIEDILVRDWSPDGKSLTAIYETRDSSGGGAHLALIDVADGRMRDLRASLDHWPTRALFSPDGRFVAYDVVRGDDTGNRDIVVRSLADENEWFVAPSRSYDELVGWGPDGTLLAFASDRSGVNALWVVPVSEGKATGEPRQVYGNVGDGTLGLTTRGALFVGVVAGAVDINVVAVDTATGKRLGEPERPVDRRLGPGRSAAWSPDGTTLAFALQEQRRGQGRTLAIRDMRTGDVRQLRTTLRNFNFPRWSPDGRAVVVQGVDKERRPGIFRVAVEGGEVTPIVHSSPGVQNFWPSWSADGQHVYFTRVSKGEGASTIERHLQTGAEREFPGVRSGIASPDGRYLLESPWQDDQGRIGELRLVPIAGGEARVVYSVREGGLPWANWTPDSKHILVKYAGKDDRDDALLIPIDGGAPTKLDLPGAQWGWMSMHPDGKRIAYLAGKQEEEVWVIENVLPQARAAQR
ncbi:hypothetical protein [Luteitalea sp. TBR-22]|uniref:hypothetical protein n=1 Tax=Luteitalea sp. TBR-22 TaxID=2802971 RepID=UPI001EF5E4FE|nr:hypothetical protein [Luteitalea sp. TBR-22]